MGGDQPGQRSPAARLAGHATDCEAGATGAGRGFGRGYSRTCSAGLGPGVLPADPTPRGILDVPGPAPQPRGRPRRWRRHRWPPAEPRGERVHSRRSAGPSADDLDDLDRDWHRFMAGIRTPWSSTPRGPASPPRGRTDRPNAPRRSPAGPTARKPDGDAIDRRARIAKIIEVIA